MSVRIITIQKIYVFGQRLARTVENQVNVPDSGTRGRVIILFRCLFKKNLVSLAFRGLCTPYIKNGICKERYNGKTLD